MCVSCKLKTTSREGYRVKPEIMGVIAPGKHVEVKVTLLARTASHVFLRFSVRISLAVLIFRVGSVGPSDGFRRKKIGEWGARKFEIFPFSRQQPVRRERT